MPQLSTLAVVSALAAGCAAAPLTLRQACDAGDPDACYRLRLSGKPRTEDEPVAVSRAEPRRAAPEVQPRAEAERAPETEPAPQPAALPRGPAAALNPNDVVGGIVHSMPQALALSDPESLPRDDIQKVINSAVPKLQRCYERALLGDIGLMGRVELEWVIAADGSVETVRQSGGDLTTPVVITCLLRTVESWRFPRPRRGNLVATYPLYFRPYVPKRP